MQQRFIDGCKNSGRKSTSVFTENIGHGVDCSGMSPLGDYCAFTCQAKYETYVRVNGHWCYLWRAVDQLIDFRLTARRNTNAARAFMRQGTVMLTRRWTQRSVIVVE